MKEDDGEKWRYLHFADEGPIIIIINGVVGGLLCGCTWRWCD